jgi:hypothetical protein
MSCERFHAALAAHAAGGELDPASAAHLAGCAACRDRLAAHQRVLAELDAELEGTLSITASPDFAARVFRSTADARSASGRRWMLSPVLAGLAIATVILMAVWVRKGPVSELPAKDFRLKAEATPPVGSVERYTVCRGFRLQPEDSGITWHKTRSGWLKRGASSAPSKRRTRW